MYTIPLYRSLISLNHIVLAVDNTKSSCFGKLILVEEETGITRHLPNRYEKNVKTTEEISDKGCQSNRTETNWLCIVFTWIR